jgi:N-acetylmuramoyl-L-alanine amidase
LVYQSLKWMGLVFVFAFLAGCASRGGQSSVIQPGPNAVSQDSRVQYLILHFTAENNEISLKYLTEGPVSSHYLVTDENPPRVLQLVSEDKRAYHAGQSNWGPNAAGLNASSIGIEIVNMGSRVRGFADFPKAQMDAVLALCKDIVQRHRIRPANVLGHSDIAPQRKDDPGPKFPWKRFAEAGLILWPDEANVRAAIPSFRAALPDVAWFQDQLAAFGYAVPRNGALDEPTRKVMAAFQMRYRPSNYDGQPDAETAAMLVTLNALAKL